MDGGNQYSSVARALVASTLPSGYPMVSLHSSFFTFSVAVTLASNDNSIGDKNSLLLAFLDKMYFAVT